jgi:hypothetical protein
MTIWLVALLLFFPAAAAMGHALPAQGIPTIDGAVHKLMADTGAKGLALAIIDRR